MQPTTDTLKITDYYSLPTLAEIRAVFPRSDSLPTNSEELPYLDPEFTKFLYKNNVYQVYTQEFIDSLVSYLSVRINEYYTTFSSPVTILEVGAGDGRLSHFLKQKLSLLIDAKKVTIIASDNKNWEKSGETNKDPKDQILNLDYKDCLKNYAKTPTIVISCWMNVDVDWTEDFRTNEHVQEYIMIGDLFRTAYYGKGYFLPKQ